MTYNFFDYYSRKARESNLLARSVFKLEEIDKRFRILYNGQNVLELGGTPGSWTRYVSEKIGAAGRCVSLDLKPTKLHGHTNVIFHQDDIMTADIKMILRISGIGSIDVVLSDAAPNTMGDKSTDHLRSYALCERALEIGLEHLCDNGSFVCKMFDGSERERFSQRMKNCFESSAIYRPRSTRKGSSEIYFVAKKIVHRK